MSRAIIQSQKAIVAASNDTGSFKTTNIDLNLINNVQNASFSIAFPHEKSKQLGSQNFSIDNTFIQPDVELTLSYIPEAKLQNEINSNFISGSNSYATSVQALAGSLPKNTNFLIINSPDDGKDALDSVTVGGSAVDLTGFEAAAFGNCFLTSYGLTYGVNSLPIVTTSYVASNAKFEKLTGTSMESPAINLLQGNNNNVGLLNFTFDNGTKDPKVPTPNDSNSSISFENLQVGGQAISGSHLVQSVDMSVALQRVSNYGFGSDFSYDRKAEMPANGSFSISSLVSGYGNGNITGVLDTEQKYKFDLILSASSSHDYAIDGTFSEGYSAGNWSSSNASQVVINTAANLVHFNTTATQTLTQTDPLPLRAVRVLITFTISDYTSGGIRLTMPTPAAGTLFNSDGTYQVEVTTSPLLANFNDIQFTSVGTTNLKLSNVSAVQVPEKLKYSVSDARLESYSSSIPVNGIMSFDASFTFPVNETVGLTLSGTPY